MVTAAELLRQGQSDVVWQKYCGFMDLNIEEFMKIQSRLLMEQIHLISKSKLGQQIIGEKTPKNVSEFRKMVPLTTYKDYLTLLQEQNTEILPAKPQIWTRTSGRSSEYDFKWAPYSAGMVNKVGEFAIGSFLLAACSDRGDVRLEPQDVCLYTLAPPPYFTGAVVANGLAQLLNPRFIPSLEAGHQMEFEERIATGFKLALKTGIDLFYGLSSVLVAIAEQLEKGSSNFEFSADLVDLQILYRVLKAFISSKFRGGGILPKDLWRIKGIVAGGMDTAFYRDTIEDYWGRKPLEGYGGTEMGGVALQAWNYKGMTFLPDGNFLEFITEEDFFKCKDDPNYQPETYCLDEVTLGTYELVVTNFHGGVFVRYRTGDLIEIVALEDDNVRIKTPQMIFHARADGVLDVGGFTRLTEKAVWQAIDKSGLPYKEWTIKKEYFKDQPVLHLYLELKEAVDPEKARSTIHQLLKEKDTGYADLETMLGINPLTLTILPSGTFAKYIEQRRAEGADLAHIKPPHIEPADKVIKQLLGS